MIQVIKELEKWQESELEKHFTTDSNIPVLDGLNKALSILKSTNLIKREDVIEIIHKQIEENHKLLKTCHKEYRRIYENGILQADIIKRLIQSMPEVGK